MVGQGKLEVVINHNNTLYINTHHGEQPLGIPTPSAFPANAQGQAPSSGKGPGDKKDDKVGRTADDCR
jgi:hypothetical protein